MVIPKHDCKTISNTTTTALIGLKTHPPTACHATKPITPTPRLLLLFKENILLISPYVILDKDNVGTAVIIPHPSVVDIKRPVPAANVSEPVVTDEHRLPQPVDSGTTNVTVSYSLWIGSNITEKRSINITADHNVTFYEIMQRASELDSAYV